MLEQVKKKISIEEWKESIRKIFDYNPRETSDLDNELIKLQIEMAQMEKQDGTSKE